MQQISQTCCEENISPVEIANVSPVEIENVSSVEIEKNVSLIQAKSYSTDTQYVMNKTGCKLRAILMSATLCFFFMTFQIAAFGAYYVVIAQHFNVSRLRAGWMGSIFVGMSYAGGINLIII